MLLVYDVRLALIAMIFLPISYLLAEKMKIIVQILNGIAIMSLLSLRSFFKEYTKEQVQNIKDSQEY